MNIESEKQYSVNPEKKLWTLLVYIAGDNDLSDAGLKDIQEMCREGASDNLYVGIQIDTYGEYSGAIRYEITPPDWSGKAHRTVIERLPEPDTGDPAVLQDFIKWGITRYPAENTLLVVWNHGSGFRSVRRNIAYDDFGSSLDMPEIESALRKAGIHENNRLQILGFDACLMNMLEVVHHFSGIADIVVGSQQTEPGDGWPYHMVLKHAKASSQPQELAQAIVSVYTSDYKRRRETGITQSAINVSATPSVVTALSRLGQELSVNMSSIRPGMQTVRMKAQAFSMADYVDLIHLMQLIQQHIAHQSIQESTHAVISSVQACVIANDHYGAGVRNANGLSVWFPTTAELYYNNRAQYLALKCNQEPFGWREFLDVYFQ